MKTLLFKRAWELYKENDRALFSECLKESWKELKEVKKVYIKDWFRYRLDLGYGKTTYSDCLCRVLKETEKAYLLEVEWFTLDGERDGVCDRWVPKSCTLTPAEMIEIEERQERAFEKGCMEYNKILDFAKKNKVKGVRKGLRKSTLLKKIKESGLTYIA